MALPDEPLDNLEGLDVEVIRGNVLSVDDAKRVTEGIDTVYHAAAIYESWAPDPGPMYRVNLQGTFNILEAARRAEVHRVVYTASVAALGRPAPGQLGDEDTPYEAWDIDFPYSRSKYLSMLLAQEFAAWGLDVRIVCPGVVIGPGDRAPTPSGRLILAVAKGKAPGYSAGGISYVDVRDAAAGHLAAARLGQPGETYVVGGHNLDNKAFLTAVGRICGHRLRPRKVPMALARAWATALEQLAVRRGKKPELTRVFLDYASRECFFDSGKAKRELGVSFRPFEDTVRDAVADFRRRGLH
jgi:dihydroflavonol-4-reductase